MTSLPGPRGSSRSASSGSTISSDSARAAFVGQRHAIGIDVEQEAGVGAERLHQRRQLQPDHPRRRRRLVREADAFDALVDQDELEAVRSFSRRSIRADVPLQQSTTTLNGFSESKS